jgi:uncharacterized protein YjbI with pentapeptide repeats
MSGTVTDEQIWDALTENPDDLNYAKNDETYVRTRLPNKRDSERNIIRGKFLDTPLTNKNFVGKRAYFQEGPVRGGLRERQFNDFRGFNFTGSNFERTNMSEGYTSLSYINFKNSILDNTDFSGHYDQNTKLPVSYAEINIELDKLIFINCQMKNINFTRSIIGEGTIFHNCNLTGSKFNNTRIIDGPVHFISKDIITFKDNKAKNSDFSNAHIVTINYYEGAEKGLEKNDLLVFKGNDFEGSSFNNTTLIGVWFQGGNLKNTSFGSSTMKDVCFSNVDLTGVEFGESQLNKVSFENVKMDQVTFDKIKNGLNSEQIAGIKGVIFLEKYDLAKLIEDYEDENVTLSKDQHVLILEKEGNGVSIDIGLIDGESGRQHEIDIKELTGSLPISEKQAWITDLEEKCKTIYGEELYKKGTNLRFIPTSNRKLYDIVKSRIADMGIEWKEEDPIRLISNGMVDNRTHPNYIGFVKTNILTKGRLYGNREAEFLFLPPEKLEPPPAQHLPPGWEMIEGDDRIYYMDHNTQEKYLVPPPLEGVVGTTTPAPAPATVSDLSDMVSQTTGVHIGAGLIKKRRKTKRKSKHKKNKRKKSKHKKTKRKKSKY